MNKRTSCVEESIHIVFDDSNPISTILSFDEELVNWSQQKVILQKTAKQTNAELTTVSLESATSIEPSKINIPIEWRHSTSFPNKFIIENLNDHMQARAFLMKHMSMAFVLQIEPKRVDEALKDKSWVKAMK